MSEPGPGPDPQPPQPEQPAATAPRANRAGLVGAMLCLGAAVLTVIGTFQPLVMVEDRTGRIRETLLITSWDVTVEANGVAATSPGPAPLNGVMLLIAVVVLLGAALLGMLAVTRAPSRRLGRASGLAAVVAAAFLTATIGTIGVQVHWWLGMPVAGDNEAAVAGAGVWTLVLGAGLAIAAAVASRRQERLEPEQEREEPETPVLGIPALGEPVLVHRLPDAPPDKPDRA